MLHRIGCILQSSESFDKSVVSETSSSFKLLGSNKNIDNNLLHYLCIYNRHQENQDNYILASNEIVIMSIRLKYSKR